MWGISMEEYEELFIPTLRSFTNENTFSGSIGPLRFFLYPQGDEILVKLWHGQFCIEKSTVELEQTFPMTEEGIEQLRAFLLEHK